MYCQTPLTSSWVDWAHRLPKPKFLPEKVPRDFIACIHFFNVKDKLMRYARQNHSLPGPYVDISVFADLSQHTMLACRQLATFTKLFQNHKIPYSWSFPTKILITRNNCTHGITAVEEGLLLARKWDLLPEEYTTLPSKSPPRKLTQEWQSVDTWWEPCFTGMCMYRYLSFQLFKDVFVEFFAHSEVIHLFMCFFLFLFS